jgi:hypothetical protein
LTAAGKQPRRHLALGSSRDLSVRVADLAGSRRQIDVSYPPNQLLRSTTVSRFHIRSPVQIHDSPVQIHAQYKFTPRDSRHYCTLFATAVNFHDTRATLPTPRRNVRSTPDGGPAVQPPGLSYTAHWEALGCALCLLTTPEISSTGPASNFELPAAHGCFSHRRLAAPCSPPHPPLSSSLLPLCWQDLGLLCVRCRILRRCCCGSHQRACFHHVSPCAEPRYSSL